jgi:hypothetical protein
VVLVAEARVAGSRIVVGLGTASKFVADADPYSLSVSERPLV